MFRNLLLSSVAFLGLLAPATLAPQAQADDHGHSHHHCHQYRVVYRGCHHESWRLYGVYHNHGRAHDVVDHLRARGYYARVIHD